jgi:TPR repeat protein
MGAPGAMYNIGVCFETGVGVATDREEALRWFSKAAGLGNAAAIERMRGGDG